MTFSIVHIVARVFLGVFWPLVTNAAAIFVLCLECKALLYNRRTGHRALYQHPLTVIRDQLAQGVELNPIISDRLAIN